MTGSVEEVDKRELPDRYKFSGAVPGKVVGYFGDCIVPDGTESRMPMDPLTLGLLVRAVTPVELPGALKGPLARFRGRRVLIYQ